MLVLTEFAKIAATAGLQEAAKKAVNGLLDFYKKNDYYFEDGETESILKEYMENAYQKYAIMNTIAFRGEGKSIFDLYFPLRIYRNSGKLGPKTRWLIGNYGGVGMSTIVSALMPSWLPIDAFNIKNKVLDVLDMQLQEHSDEYELSTVETICKSPDRIEDLVNFVRENGTVEQTNLLDTIINRNSFVINDDFIERLDDLDNIMIIDNAGMGKSTLSRYISILSISSKKYIPIIIELRKIKRDHSIWEELFSQLDMFDRHLEISKIKEQLRHGGFIVIFDGFDEVTDENKPYVITWIKEFVSKASENKYILTSRQESALASFGEFIEYAIQPLKELDAFDMILQFGKENECSKRLVQCIKEDSISTPTFREFLSNPLMVSLLYRTYQYTNDLPRKKNEFYSQVYDALYCDHDKTKEGFIRPKRCGLSKNEFENVLRWLGWFSFQSEQIEFSHNDLLDIVQDAIENTEKISCSAEDFIYDITHTVPLFEYIGTGIKWCHKSFMEYFSARCLYKDASDLEKAEILKELFRSNNSISENKNLITFFIEMDYKSCRDYVYIPYIQEMIYAVENSKYWNTFYKYFSKTKIEENNAQNLAKSIILVAEIDQRGKRSLADLIHLSIKGFYNVRDVSTRVEDVQNLLNDGCFADEVAIEGYNPFLSLMDFLEGGATHLSIMDYRSYHEVLMNLKKEHTKKRNFSINKKH